jgi:hypothetical protein
MFFHPFEPFITTVSEAWIGESEVLRRRGCVAAADTLLALAHELVAGSQEWLDESLTLREASDWSGLAYGTLEARIRAGTLPNAGRKGSPRIRRRDLPIAAPQRAHTHDRIDDADDLDQLLGALDV